MTTKVYLSSLGEPVDPERAMVSVFDRGFLYGDSVYETMRTSGGRPVELGRHLVRLGRSGAGIGLPIPSDQAELAAIIEATHRATGNPESYVRLMVTRGSGPIMLDPRQAGAPTIVVIAATLALPQPSVYTQGISASLVTADKTGGSLIDPGIKTGNYLANILALQQAIAEGADDAILCNAAGEVSEGATSNVFMVVGGRVVTPHLRTGLLAGITRELVCELAEAEANPIREAVVTVAGLAAADEVFLTSSVRGIMPVTRLGGVQIGSGREGPITARLRGRYEAYLESLGAP